MVFIHDPRSEDIPDYEVNEGDKSTWRSLCCFGYKYLQKLAEENSNLSNANNNTVQSYAPQDNILNPNVSTYIGESQPSNNVVNIIKNHDFSKGFEGWRVISKGESGYVVPMETNYLEDVLPYSGIYYAIVTRRLEADKGLEQDITGTLKDNVQYTLSAWVRVYNVPPGADGKAKVKAILRLEYQDGHDWYPHLVSSRVSTDEWTKLESTFNWRDLKSHRDQNPKGVVFKLEGPDEGVDLLVDSVVISPSSTV